MDGILSRLIVGGFAQISLGPVFTKLHFAKFRLTTSLRFYTTRTVWRLIVLWRREYLIVQSNRKAQEDGMCDPLFAFKRDKPGKSRDGASSAATATSKLKNLSALRNTAEYSVVVWKFTT